MKPLTLLRVSFPFWLSLTTASAAIAPVQSEPAVIQRGPHHNVWNWTAPEQGLQADGVNRTHSYTEIASGLNYWSEQEQAWTPASEEIEIIDGHAVARHGQLQIIWAANANSVGAVDVQSSDGKRFQSHLLGLAFTDRKTGASFFFGMVKDSIGQVVGNQVYYASAFEGINADILYTYRRSGLEQFILLREGLPDPSQAPWNLDPANVMVEVYTEFLDPPPPTITSVVLKRENDPIKRAAMAEPDVIDQQLSFGATAIGRGMAFLNGMAGPAQEIPVAKSFEVREQKRHVLIERVEYPIIKQQMAALAPAPVLTKQRVAKLEADVVQDKDGLRKSRLPKASVLTAKSKDEPMRIAQAIPSGKAFVLDYSQLNTATNLTLKADTTYYCSGIITLSGTTTIEGGCIVKYTNGSRLRFAGPVVCLTSPRRPAVFTARDDHTIGQQIGTNTLNGTYAEIALDFGDGVGFEGYGSGLDLNNLRVSFAYTGVSFYYGTNSVVKNAQFVNCQRAFSIYGGEYSLRNILAANGDYLIVDNGWPTIRAEHLTAREIGHLLGYSSTLFLTNSLLVAVTNIGTYTGSNVETNGDPSSVFQTIGGGSAYLANGSPYRNAGTTNINSALAAELRKLTTYPPTILNNLITIDTTLSPNAQRDIDTPDLGYHYAPLDYASTNLWVTNATLTLTPGTAIAGYGAAPIWVEDGGSIISEGTPDNRNFIGRYNCVQELSTNWGGTPSQLLMAYHYGSNAGTGRLRFTDFAVPASGGSLIYAQSTWSFGSFSARDCEFYGGIIYLGGNSNSVCGLTNNLFARTQINLFGDGQMAVFNNLVYGPYFYTENPGLAANWALKDNAFDGTWVDDAGNTTNDYNAYINTTDQLYGSGGHDLVLTNFVYATGPLGWFYQYSTNLLDKGSRSADAAGLYHYVTGTNQFMEGTSPVDIGLHYVQLTPSAPVVSTNMALSYSAVSQSSTGYSGYASYAVDGVTGGDYSSDHVTHTEEDAQAWWQVDLGSVRNIETIRVWNRTDCCGERLNDSWVLVSANAFTSTNLATSTNQAGVFSYHIGTASVSNNIPVFRSGRYVRVQLAGTDYLSLAELQIMSQTVNSDSDGDGVWDYQEDWNGNGIVNSGETDWNSATDLGLRVQITRPANNSIIP